MIPVTKYILKNYVHNPELSLVEFIYLFLTKFNRKYSTFEGETFICDTYRSRSLGDITAICNGYNYETIKEEVKEILLDFGKNLVGHYCSGINKRVYEHKKLRSSWVQSNEGYKDEYGDTIDYRLEDKNKEILKNSKFCKYE